MQSLLNRGSLNQASTVHQQFIFRKFYTDLLIISSSLSGIGKLVNDVDGKKYSIASSSSVNLVGTAGTPPPMGKISIC